MCILYLLCTILICVYVACCRLGRQGTEAQIWEGNLVAFWRLSPKLQRLPTLQLPHNSPPTHATPCRTTRINSYTHRFIPYSAAPRDKQSIIRQDHARRRSGVTNPTLPVEKNKTFHANSNRSYYWVLLPSRLGSPGHGVTLPAVDVLSHRVSRE